MSDLLRVLWNTLGQMDPRSVLDILVVALIFYGVLMLMRGTTGMTLLRGIVTLLAGGFILGSILQLTMFNWLLRNSVTALLIAIPILFQPELRRALERIGRTGLKPVVSPQVQEQLIETLSHSCQSLSDRRYGGLIVLEGETGLQDYIDTGVALDAQPSTELLVSIFHPGTPLHDGAVILREGRVAAAACVLPLTERQLPDMQLGTRHRAALGITEQTDAIALVVSEETGTISVAHSGRMVRGLDEVRMRRLLRSLYGAPRPQPTFGLWWEKLHR